MQRLMTLLFAVLLALPLSAQAWWQAEWSYRKQISIDTTAEGASLTAPVGRMPVLIRLHPGNFSFDGVREDGADLRFVTADDKTVLRHQIERFDALMGIAYIWVDVPQVGPGERQDLWMYYGNDQAPVVTDSAQVFDPNYTLVYHFEGDAGTVPRDTTAFGNQALTPLSDVAEGIIGGAAQFNGTQSLMLPSSPSLSVPAGSLWTFSLWLRPDQIRGQQAIYLREDAGQSLLIGLDEGMPFVAVNGQRSEPGTALAAGRWQHLAVVADGTQLTILVDGRVSSILQAALPPLATTALLGGPGDAVPLAQTEEGEQIQSAGFFIGAMDELRLSKIARSEALLRTEVQSQGAESRLVAFGVDEEQSGFGFGGLGFLLGAVPIDAWIIIGVLVLMMLQSWIIMFRKNRAVSRMEQDNAAFRTQFARLGPNVEGLAHVDQREFEHSSLWRLYRAAVNELQTRRQQGVLQLTPATMESIRASMDRARTEQQQQLSSRLGALSNAIAGGPYIGLLGTVLGIMVVFLGTAMAGDVNINAIAPGMAAALLATAMGLFVAIPALFGYNRLVGRNRNMNADMRVFLDEFMTRLAEQAELDAGHPAQRAGDARQTA